MENVIIIAEAGVNHNGSLKLAKKLIDVAANAGADYVKFQTYKSHNLVSKYAKKAKYQVTNTNNSSDTQLEMLSKLELNERMHFELLAHCEKRKINFLSTAFDLESLNFLNQININLFKVPSGEITNLPYLRQTGKFGKRVILSTGMANLQEIEDALCILEAEGISRKFITVLHCNTQYPTPMEDVNLNAMITIKEKLKVNIGYSDHTLGIEVPIAAVAMGATVIEKHFTFDKSLEGPDHKASLSPIELKRMVKAIRNIEKALGRPTKEPTNSELENKIVTRKSLVAATAIKKGEVFTDQNLTIKRPGNGISPMRWDEYIGKRATRDYLEDELI